MSSSLFLLSKLKYDCICGLGYFKGASKLYSEKQLKENVNPHPEPSDTVIQKLRQELQIDLELYHFILQRFNIQLQHVKSLQNYL